MILSETDLKILYNCAIGAAYQAGHYISASTNTHLEVKSKADGLNEEELRSKVGGSLASQVVTEVDRNSQNIILSALEATIDKFDLGLLTEESVDDASRFKKDYFWCIDPMDGTLPFIEGTAGYSVAIALVSKQGEPIIGVVYDPVKKNLYSALKGDGVKRNGMTWNPSVETPAKSQPLRLITDRSFFNYRFSQQVVKGLSEVSKQLGYSGVSVMALGGAVMNACWGLEKAPACYFKFPKKNAGGGSLWDYAASAAIYNEAGAVVSDLNGEPLELNREDSTFMNHKGALYATQKEIGELIKANYQKWIKEK